MRTTQPDKKEFAEWMDQNKGIIYKVAMLYTHNQEDKNNLFLISQALIC
jgi:hypothetical protein